MAGLLDPPIFRDQAPPSGVLGRMLVQPPPADGVTDVSLFDLNKNGPLQSPTVTANPPPTETVQGVDATPVQLDQGSVAGTPPKSGRMTVLTGNQPTGLTPRADDLITPAQGKGIIENLAASFDYGNDAVNVVRGLTSQQFTPDPNFAGPLSIIAGTPFEEDHLDRFVGAQSEAETRSIMARIVKEDADKAVNASSGFLGFISGVASGAVSPTMLLPFGWLRFAKVGVDVAKAARLGIKAAEGAAIGAAAVGTQEAILHQFSETRTAEETWWNVVGAAAIGGVLGTAGAAISRETIDRMAANVKKGIPSSLADEIRLWNEGTPAGVGAAASDTARGTGELKGAFGAENLALDPLRRLQTSPFQSARNTIRDLAETPLTLAENAEGIATTIGGSVETGVKLAQGPLAEGLGAVDDQFQRYFFGGPTRFAGVRAGIARATGQTDRMSLSQFREATFDALIAGDTHPVPEVQAAASALRRTVFDPLKNEAIGVRLFDENVKPLGDEGYAPRHYLPEVIAARRGDFVDILIQHFEAKQADLERAVSAIEARGAKPPESLFKTTDMTKGEIRAAAEDTTDTILGNSPNRMILPKDLVAGPRGPLKERLLGIPTRLIRDFVEKDVAVLARLYSRTMATDIGLIKKFGSIDLADQLSKINDEANGLIAKATTEKQRTAIDNARKASLRDLGAIRDRLRGTYGLPSNPHGLAARAIKVVKDLNYLRLLGGMTISSITDPGHIVAIHGLTRTLKTAFLPFTKGLKSIKLAADEVKLAGAALDMILDSRVMAITDVMDGYGRGSRLERGVHWAAQKFGVMSLMAPWNVAVKQLAGITAQTRILEGVEALAAGKANPKEVEFLAAAGIDAPTAQRIWRQVAGVPASEGARTAEVARPAVAGPVSVAKVTEPPTTSSETVAPAAVPAPAESVRKPVNAWRFVLNMGGVKDPTGELKASGLHRQVIGLVRKNGGKDPDIAREALAEAGYFHGFGSNAEAVAKTTLADFYDLMARGKGAFSDEDAIAAEASHRASNIEHQDVELRASIDSHVSEFGLSLDEPMMARAEELVRGGLSIDDAVERASIEKVDAFVPDDLRSIVDEIPGFTDASHSQGLPEGGQPATSEGGNASVADGKGGRLGGGKDTGQPSQAEGQAVAGQEALVNGHGGSDGSVRWANTGEWTDPAAVRAFRAALVREVDRAIITPGQDKPLWMSKGMGQLLGQFRSFAMSATQRNLIAGLQQRDAAAFNGMMVMLSLGALQYWLKSQISGAPVSDNPTKWAVEAFDNSGLAGWMLDANNITEKLTSGRVGLSALTGQPAQRYASRNAMGALLGPSFDAASDLISLSQDASKGTWTAADSRALRRLTPLQNLFYLRKLFDQVEAGANSAAGIPTRTN